MIINKHIIPNASDAVVKFRALIIATGGGGGGGGGGGCH